MDANDVAKVRKSLIEDPQFRAKFADAPGDALRGLGIAIPAGVKFAPVSLQKLEAEVTALKHVAGGNVNALFDPKMVETEIKGSAELSDDDLEKVAGGALNLALNTQLRNAPFMNFTRELGRLPIGGKIPGGQYWISVCGTADF